MKARLIALWLRIIGAVNASDAAEVVGGLLVCVGVGLIYIPAAVILAGLMVIVFGMSLDKGVAG